MLKRNIKCCYGFCIDKIYAVTYDVKLGECSAGHYFKEYALNVLNAATTKYIDKEVHQLEYISQFQTDIYSLCQKGLASASNVNAQRLRDITDHKFAPSRRQMLDSNICTTDRYPLAMVAIISLQ